MAARSALLILAAKNPLDAAHMVLIVAGNDALRTVKSEKADLPAHEYLIVRDGDEPIKGFMRHDSTTPAPGPGHP